MKTSTILLASVVSTLVACSGKKKQEAEPQCGRSNLTSDKSMAAELRLVPQSQEDEQRLGLAYLDISTEVADGTQLRRCTASLHFVDGQPDLLKITTAQHCGWDSHTPEFRNSKHTLQVWYETGYFPIYVELIGHAEWGTYARTLHPYAGFLPERTKKGFINSTSEAAAAGCRNLTAEIRADKKNIKDVLCFSSEESRNLLAKITVDAQHREKLNRVMTAVDRREKAALENLPEPEKSIFNYVSSRPSSYEKLPAYLTELGFRMNKYFCDTKEADGPFDINGKTESRSLCFLRPAILNKIEQELPEQFKFLKAAAEKDFNSKEEMQDFYANNIRCNLKVADAITAANFRRPTSICDQDTFMWKVWLRWGQNGLRNLNDIQIKDRSIRGFNEESFYALRTNSPAGGEAALTGDISQSRSSVISISNQLSDIFAKDNALSFLIDPASANIWISKKDSGSLLSVFGVFPAAVISTYNGEPTSGGASILPLPEPSEDKPTSTGGC